MASRRAEQGCQNSNIGYLRGTRGGYLPNAIDKGGRAMLWLILGIVLLIIAIAGGAIIHPILFAIAILALVMFFVGRGRTV
jgi:hypothetical protein